MEKNEKTNPPKKKFKKVKDDSEPSKKEIIAEFFKLTRANDILNIKIKKITRSNSVAKNSIVSILNEELCVNNERIKELETLINK